MERTATSSNKPLRQRRAASRLAAWTLAALVAVVACACAPSKVFHSDFCAVDIDGWKKSRFLSFELPDSAMGVDAYSISVAVRHANGYKYRDLWLVADFVAGGKVVRTDTVEIVLSDDYGNWTGSGLGGLFQQSSVVEPRVAAGEFERVVVWQAMRQEAVSDITEVGLIYSKVE